MPDADPNATTTSTTTSPPTPPDPMTPPVYEPAASLVPAEPVLTQGPQRRRSRMRWIVAAVVVALVVGSSAAVAAVLTGTSPAASILGYVPGDSIAYAELRLDLPGDQRQAAAAFLSKFPGFRDQAALESKLDEALDKFLADVTSNGQTYTKDIKPWFGGEVGVTVGPLPAAATLSSGSSAPEFRAIALLSVKDPAAAQAWFDRVIADSGAKTTKETYQGVSLTLSAEPGVPVSAFGIVDGKVALLGDRASVKAAIDTAGKSDFASQAGPRSAFDANTQDTVGFAYIALKPIVSWSSDLSKAMTQASPGASSGMAMTDDLVALVPEWAAAWLRFENDAIVMESVTPVPASGSVTTSDHTSTVVDHVPADALAVEVANDFGSTLNQALAAYRKIPAYKPMVDRLDQALGLLGGTSAAIDWIGDSAIVVEATAGSPDGGLIVLPTDKAAASRFFTSLESIVALGGGQIGATITKETDNGTEVTVVTVSDLGALAGRAGLPAGATLPTNVQIAWAVTDDMVVIGSGPAFVKHVLATTKADSLGASSRYTDLVGRLGKTSAVIYVDIAAIRGLAEGAIKTLDPTAAADYEKNVKPYIEPFDALIAGPSVNGDLSTSTFIVTVK